MDLLLEMPWLRVTQEIKLPTTTGRTVTVDFVDIRLEDMIKHNIVPRKAAAGWYAQLPGSDAFITDNGDITGDEPQGSIKLPDDWWQYTYGLYQDQNVKASVHPRTEQGEKTQEELDRQQLAESYHAKLDRLFSRPYR